MTDLITFHNAAFFAWAHYPNTVQFAFGPHKIDVIDLPVEAIVEGFNNEVNDEPKFAGTIVISTVNLEWCEFRCPEGYLTIQFRRRMTNSGGDWS